MLFKKFVSLVETHAEDLTKKWINEVRNNPSTPNYHNMNEKLLVNRISDLFFRLGKWLSKDDFTDKETVEHFISLGRERALEGLEVSEVIYALILTKAVLWKYVVSQGIINTIIDMHQALEFHNKISNFFDKAIYYIAVGFESPLKKSDAEKHKETFVNGAVDAITRWLIDGKK